LDKFAEFKRRNKTILLVTHSLGLVERFCDEALWLDAGRIKGSGDPKRIVGAYLTDIEHREEQELASGDAKARESARAAAVPPDRRCGGDVRDRRARSRRRDVQTRRRRPQARRVSLRLPPAALYVPRQVAREGRRHLSPEARMAVLRRHPLHEDVMNVLDAAG